MRRTFLIGFLSSFVLVLSSSAQYHGGQVGGFSRSASLAPIGSVGRAPIVSPFGRTLNNNGAFGFYNSGGLGSYGRGRRGYGYGYGIAAYPVYIGGLSGDYYPGYVDPSLAAAPQYNNPPAPPVVINQYFSGPAPGGPPPEEQQDMQVYSQQPTASNAPLNSQPAPSAEPRTYLIAYKDHSVYSAVAYWIEDHTLNYVTTQNTHNQADLALIDVDFTKKLNQDRNMSFSLNPVQR